MSISSTASAVPAAIIHPVTTVRTHPYLVFAMIIVATVLAVVFIEAKRPGFFASLVRRAPFVGPRIASGQILRAV
jgi:hypothetical protein